MSTPRSFTAPPARRPLRRAGAYASLLLLAACASAPPSRPLPQPEPVPEVGVETTPQSEVEMLLERAAAQPDADQRARYLVQAGTLLREQDNRTEALAVLASVDTDRLPPVRLAAVRLLQAELLMEDGAAEESLALLQPAQFPPLEGLDSAAHARFYRQRALAFEALNAPLDSLNERLRLDALLPADERQENHDALWDNLKRLPLDQLRLRAGTTTDFAARGWYELALAMRTVGADLDQMGDALQRWQDTWGRHPAALTMPGELSLSLDAQLPPRIALLLPLGTNAGTVVLDSFLSAYYSRQNLGREVPELRIYDSTDATDILPLHQQARSDGAQLIIGPLLKQHVTQLLDVADLGVPTLALNNVEGARPASPLLYQFALSPEDEARQLARKAWNDGHRFAAILSPRDDAASDFYTRKRQAFLEEWLTLGGKVVARDNYLDDYTNTINTMLELDTSNQRRRRLQEVINRPVLFDQRRRQDIDFIYLIAQPGPARQIMPSLAYLFAGDIPVYASQDLYSGTGRSLEDRDLNGVVFPESPWLLGEDEAGVDHVRQLFPQNNAQNLRLQAFGIDAFRLAPRLSLLRDSSDFSVPGTTGTLRLGPQQNITRELSWATIVDGVVRPAP